MKPLFSLLALFPATAMALHDYPIDLPRVLPAPEIDGGMAIMTVVLVGGIATLVKRARDKARTD